MRRHKWYWCFPLGPANGGCFLRIWDSPNVEEDSFELNLKSGWMQKYVKLCQNPSSQNWIHLWSLMAYLGYISNASWFYRSTLAICWNPHGNSSNWDAKAIHRCSWTLHWTRASPMLEAHPLDCCWRSPGRYGSLVNPHLPVKDVHPQDVAFQSMIITILYTWLYIYMIYISSIFYSS